MRRGHDIEHARRQAGTLPEFGDRQRAQGCEFGRLDDDGAAGGQGRADLACDHRDRKVPRRDRGAHTHRLLDDEVALVGVGGRNRLAVDALAFLGEPLDEAGAVHHLALGFDERLALLGGNDPGQVVGVIDHEVEPPHQDGVALLGGFCPPARPSSLRCGQRLARLLRAEVGHVGKLAAGRRIAHVEARAAGDPLAADQRVGFQQAGVGESRERGGFHVHGASSPD